MKKLKLEIEQLEVESFGTVEGGEDGRGTVRGLGTSETACATKCGGDGCQTVVPISFGAAPDEGCVVEEYTSFVWREDGLCQSVDIC
jgi:hypothetical protein